MVRNEMVNNLTKAVKQLKKELGKSVSCNYTSDNEYNISIQIANGFYIVEGELSECYDVENVIKLFSTRLTSGNAKIRIISTKEIELRDYIKEHELDLYIDFTGDVFVGREHVTDISDLIGLFQSMYSDYDIIQFQDFSIFVDFEDNCRLILKEFEVA